MPTGDEPQIPADASGAPVIWLDQPRDPTHAQAGEYIPVQAHARDGDGPGVTLVGLYINGELWESKNTDTSSPLVNVLFDSWVPQHPGEYLVEVEAISEFGATSQRARAMVIIPGEAGEDVELVEVQEPQEEEQADTTPTKTPTSTVSREMTSTPSITATITASATPSPSPTSTHTPTASPTVTTAVPKCSHGARWIADVTIPDGTQLEPGESFNKVWRIENIGTCPWDAGYRLIFHGGDFGSENSPHAFTSSNVMPGAKIEISMHMTAPTAEGSQESHWKMRSSEGETFFFGPAGDGTLYTEIRVQSPAPSCPDDAPPDVTATRNGEYVTIDWSDVPCATGYWIDLEACIDANTMQEQSRPNTEKPLTILDRGVCSENSWAKIRSCWNATCFDTSPWKDISWPAAPKEIVYAPPTNVTATRSGDYVNVYWDSPPDALGFFIWAKTRVGSETYKEDVYQWVKSGFEIWDDASVPRQDIFGRMVACYDNSCFMTSDWVEIPWP